MFDIVLMEPRKQENLGAIARCMKNFGFSQLILIEPKCKIGITAKKVAKHAQDVLQKGKSVNRIYLKKYDYVIGTTAILGTDYNIPRNAISAKLAAEKIATLPESIKIAILLGREGSGLTNEEVEACDMLVTIPASKKYPTLNLSHSLCILAYEIFQAQPEEKSNSHLKFASEKEKEVILGFMDEILNQVEFPTKEKKETQKKVWKRVIGKAMLTKREAFAVMGLLRKLIKR